MMDDAISVVRSLQFVFTCEQLASDSELSSVVQTDHVTQRSMLGNL